MNFQKKLNSGDGQTSLQDAPHAKMSSLTQKCNRKQVASRFYTCLLDIVLVDYPCIMLHMKTSAQGQVGGHF